MWEAAVGWPYGVLSTQLKHGLRLQSMRDLSLSNVELTMPVQAAGIRSEPPISVPTPNGLPHMAISEDSPPEEPPDVSARFNGFTVRP